MSVVLYDINRLKDERSSWPCRGDYLIRSAANAVRCEFNLPQRYGFRLSGDEFACAYSPGDAASTRVKIERARTALPPRLRSTEPPYEMGFCFGIAEAVPRSAAGVVRGAGLGRPAYVRGEATFSYRSQHQRPDQR